MERRTFLSMVLGAGGVRLLNGTGFMDFRPRMEPASATKDGKPIINPSPDGLYEEFLQFENSEEREEFEENLLKRAGAPRVPVIRGPDGDAWHITGSSGKFWYVAWEHGESLDILMSSKYFDPVSQRFGIKVWLDYLAPATFEEAKMFVPRYMHHICKRTALIGKVPKEYEQPFEPTEPGIERILAPTKGMLIWRTQLLDILRLVMPGIQSPMIDDVAYCCMKGKSECCNQLKVYGRTLDWVLRGRAALMNHSDEFDLWPDNNLWGRLLWEAMTYPCIS